VEEIGIGGMFKQSDLQETECYLLDGGTSVIFVWHGLDSSYHGRALCTRVCQRYLTELQRDHDICASPQFRSTFPLPAQGSDLEIRYLQSRQESLDFTQYFPKWISRIGDSTSSNNSDALESMASRLPLCVSFDPSEVTADESLDEKYDRTGRAVDLTVKTKTRYSDGAPSTRPHANTSAASNQTSYPDPYLQKTSAATAATQSQAPDSFVPKVALKPAADRKRAVTMAAASTEQDQVPEFVAKRNALKSVRCPDPLFADPAAAAAAPVPEEAIAIARTASGSSSKIHSVPKSDKSKEPDGGDMSVPVSPSSSPSVREAGDSKQAACCVIM
jgi:hypothetical protein